MIAIDEETDLAVIKVDEEGLPALEFADSDEVRPGQLVLAFGSPMGLNSSVTLGVVSAVARQLETTEEDLMHTVFPHPTLSEMMHESVLAAFGRVIHI